jgi:hypothetical protein
MLDRREVTDFGPLMGRAARRCALFGCLVFGRWGGGLAAAPGGGFWWLAEAGWG